ncbi:MAG: rod shape-determining protein MreD [Lachnospiraceae bacterium]|nr:rod shape-determining protein MreD [Lachnospiraceae bacterium]
MKLIRFFIICAEIFICFVLENIFPLRIAGANIYPDLLIIIVCGSGYMFGSSAGTLYGFLAGLLFDIANPGAVGFTAFIFSVAGFISGVFRKFYKRSNNILPLGLIAVFEYIYMSMYYLANFLVRGRVDYLLVTKTVILPKVTLTVLVAVLLYKLFQLSVGFTFPVERKKIRS